MANPYGITQVDVPGALSAYMGARQGRIQQMLLQRRLAQEEREAERQGGIQAAFQRYAGGNRGEGESPVAPPPQAPEPVGGAPAPQGIPQTGQMAPQAAPQPQAGDRQALFNNLLALDPQVAFQTMQALRQMDEAQFEQVEQRNAILGRAAQYLLTLPEDRWQAEFQRIAPALMEQGGLTPEQLQSFQVTRQNLQFVVAQARDIEKLAEEARPRLRNVRAGDVVIDERNPGGGPVYESPFVEVGGDIYRRPPSMSEVRPTEEQLRAQAEEAIRQGADPQAVNQRLEQMLQQTRGGPSRDGSGGFP